jgi:hypothetical protein
MAREHPRHVGLIGEPGVEGEIGQRTIPLGQPLAHPLDPDLAGEVSRALSMEAVEGA